MSTPRSGSRPTWSAEGGTASDHMNEHVVLLELVAGRLRLLEAVRLANLL